MNVRSSDEPVIESYDVRNNNGMDLFVLWQSILQEKVLILSIALFVLLAAGSYAFLAKPVYQSKAYFVPVEKEFIQKLVGWDLLLERNDSYTAQELFKLFKQNIVSRSELLTFFTKHKLYGVYDEALSKIKVVETLKEKQKIQKSFDQFYQDFLVQESKEGGIGQYLSVALAMTLSEKEVQQLLSEYIAQVRNKTRQEILESIKNEQESRVGHIQQKISSMREIAKVQKNDRLAQLDEAITIARSLNLKEPPKMGAKATIQGVSNQGLPLYYLGYRLLEAERKVLAGRQSNDPFIDGLRGLQEKLSLLSSYKISSEDFAMVRLDQSPIIGEKIKPKKSVILVVSVIVGLLLGIFVALIKVAFSSQKQKEAMMSVTE